MSIGGRRKRNCSSILDRSSFVEMKKEFSQLLDIDKRTLTKKDLTVARVGYDSEIKIPTKRMVIDEDKQCEITFTIISKTAHGGAYYYNI